MKKKSSTGFSKKLWNFTVAGHWGRAKVFISIFAYICKLDTSVHSKRVEGRLPAIFASTS